MLHIEGNWSAKAFPKQIFLGASKLNLSINWIIGIMVLITVKKGDEVQFLVETSVTEQIDDLLSNVVPIFNGRLKVERICAEMEELASHGITLPPNMMGLTDEQVEELKLKDEWADRCIPQGGAVFNKDDIGRRNGQAPNTNMQEVLRKTIKEAKDMISKKVVHEAINILQGAVTIVYPMGLPPHDNIRMEFENKEDLNGTQASKDVMQLDMTSLWWAGKELLRGKKLLDFVGKNEKTKIVAKIQKKGQGAPGREPVVSQDEQRAMMAHYHKRQEDLKKLAEAEDDSYMDSNWADGSELKKQFHGLGNIQWAPGKR